MDDVIWNREIVVSENMVQSVNILRLPMLEVNIDHSLPGYLYHLHRKGAFLILTHFIDASKYLFFQFK